MSTLPETTLKAACNDVLIFYPDFFDRYKFLLNFGRRKLKCFSQRRLLLHGYYNGNG